MICLSYLPFLAAAVAISKAESTLQTGVLTGCPMPEKPLFLVADNQHHAYPDTGQYKETSVTLPLKCVSENFVLEKPVSAKCVNKKWTKPEYKCVALITLKRQVTNKIMIASGVVMGVTAAIFVIVKVVLYKTKQNKGDKLPQSRDSAEIPRRANQRPGGWDPRPESKMVYENDAYVGYNDLEGQASFEPRPYRTLEPEHRGSQVYSDIYVGPRYNEDPSNTTQRL